MMSARIATRIAARLDDIPPGLLLAWLFVAMLALMTVWPSGFTHYSGIRGAAAEHLQAPGHRHWFGTDQLGRDMFARVAYGATNTLRAALLAVSIGLTVGAILGLLAGATGGRADSLIMAGVDIVLSIPELLLSLSIVILLGFGTVHAAISVGIAQIAGFARIVRGDALRVRNSEFVEAAYGCGSSHAGVLWRHILPNCLSSAASLAVLRFSTAILSIATLGFLGYGTPPPTPEWGLMIAEGRNYLATAWWMTSFPGLAVLCVSLAAYRISHAIGTRA
ncbi:ABC transporter permease [Nguyenibacter vanlangensis]|uniref:ABC transporter permease n=2 Tax=Nguyenibacter vanlangensis TaxID=1216886 RepID=A0A7Y7M7F9_9PROT|nr:ABC transporter permease [Nguyenibacter vanlangensis]